MQRIESQLATMLNCSRFEESDFRLLSKVVNSVPKDAQADAGSAKAVLDFLDAMFCMPELLPRALPVLALLSHYEQLMGLLLTADSRARFQLFKFPMETTDADRLVFVLVALVDKQQPQSISFPAALALEGLTYYPLGKKKAVLAGAIEQLDDFICSEAPQYESGFDMHHVVLLECLSNLIGSKSSRQLCKEVQGRQLPLLTTLTCPAALFAALRATRNTKQARAVCACIFNLLLDNYDRFCTERFLTEDAVQKLVLISTAYPDEFGGKAASLSLLVIHGRRLLAQSSNVQPTQLPEDATEELRDNFAEFRLSIKQFKQFSRMMKQTHLFGEMLLSLDGAFGGLNCETDFVENVVQKLQDEIDKVHAENEAQTSREQADAQRLALLAKTTGTQRRQGLMRMENKGQVQDI